MNWSITLVCSLAAVIVLGIAPGAHAQLAKQGTFEIVSVADVVVADSLKFGDYSITAAGGTLVNLNKAGSGLFHNTTSQCKLVVIPGAFHGFCATQDLDGDFIFHRNFTEGEFMLGSSGGGRKMVILGGTGKYEGIQGEASYTFTYAPKAGNKLVGHAVMTGKYRIP